MFRARCPPLNLLLYLHLFRKRILDNKVNILKTHQPFYQISFAPAVSLPSQTSPLSSALRWAFSWSGEEKMFLGLLIVIYKWQQQQQYKCPQAFQCFSFLNGIHSPSACAGLIWPSRQNNHLASWWTRRAYSTEEAPVGRWPGLDGSWKSTETNACLLRTNLTTSNTGRGQTKGAKLLTRTSPSGNHRPQRRLRRLPLERSLQPLKERVQLAGWSCPVSPPRGGLYVNRPGTVS